MKRYIVALVLAMSFIFSSVVAQAGEVIAVVDLQLIIEKSKAANDVNGQIKKKRDKYQAEIEKEEASLRKLDEKLAESRSILSKEAFEEERKKFKTKLIDVQRDVQAKRAKLDTAFSKAIEDIQSNVTIIISDMSKEQGFKIAVPASQILYTQDSLDITKEVLKRLDKKLPKLKIKG